MVHHGGVQTEVEIERKFRADDALEIAGLESIEGVAAVAAPVEHDLDAEYFDTVDLSLYRIGTVVRRRRGGPDEGWHVKVERPDGSRLEVHESLGSEAAAVPPELMRLLVLHVHGRELVPVASVRNRRRVHLLLDGHGRRLAEVCDDHVTATSASGGVTAWRELEVELAGDGDHALLERVGEHLEGCGAEPAPWPSKLSRALGEPELDPPSRGSTRTSTAGDVVAAYLIEQAESMRRLDVAVRLDADDAVHKMRVGVRRLRSTLATYRRLLDRDITEPIRDELKWLGGVLGEVRDAEVIRRYLERVVDEQPPALVVGPVRGRVAETSGATHATAHRRAVEELSSARYLALMAGVAGIGEAVGGKLARQPAKRRLRKEIRRTHRRLAHHLERAMAEGDPTDEQLHDVRKSIKRARYAAEAAVDVFGERARNYVAGMQAAQETLGDQQDSVVVREVLTRLASEATAAGESAFTYGRLHALEERRGRKRAKEFLREVDHGWARRPARLG